MTEIDLEFLKSHRAHSRRLPTLGILGAARLLFRLGGRTEIEVENLWLPDRPVIYATNHTHNLDFLPLWVQLVGLGERLVGWVKARMYKKWYLRAIMRSVGNNAPLVSKGYLIAADFRQVNGRAPTDAEYRVIRDHVDDSSPMPDHGPFGRLREIPRDILGRRFEPALEEYDEAMRDLFYLMMCEILEVTRSAVRDGHHLHIHPEGRVTRHMTRGRTGVVQAALALDMPIVPVGISGADRAFVGPGPRTRGGTIRLRFGAPILVDEGVVPPDFRPFHPDDSMQHQEVLQATVDGIVRRLDGLVDEEYRFDERAEREGVRGVARFY